VLKRYNIFGSKTVLFVTTKRGACMSAGSYRIFGLRETILVLYLPVLRNPKEDQMTSLKSLNIVPLPKSGGNPTLDRRARIIVRLEEQKELLRDSAHVRSVRSWSKDAEGKKVLVETKQRVLPWWNTQPNGTFVFFIRSGWKPIEFEKGKAAIAVPSLEKLPAVIDTLISAVRSGELDEQLAQASSQSRPPKSKARRVA